jgi:hypothetical protein
VTTRAAVLAAVACALLGAAGCGGGGGVADGATVTAYVAAPLCGEAKRELAREGARAGDLRVRLLCLAGTGSAGDLDLAAVGANARRATEDSSAVGYLEPPGPAGRFSRPILEAAGVAVVTSNSGEVAMGRLLSAIADADPGSLRASVLEALDG